MALLMSTTSAVVVTAQVTSPCRGPSPLRRRPAMRAAAHPPARSARMPLTIHQSPAPMPNAVADGVSPEIGLLIVAPIATPRRPRSTIMAVAMAAPAKIAPQADPPQRGRRWSVVVRSLVPESPCAGCSASPKPRSVGRRDSACIPDPRAPHGRGDTHAYRDSLRGDEVWILGTRPTATAAAHFGHAAASRGTAITGAIAAAAARTIRHARVGPIVRTRPRAPRRPLCLLRGES